jgi:hypothetical protein
MSSRRKFLGQVATGIGGLALPQSVLGANNKIRFGVIGYGARGQDIVRDALNCANTEFAAVCDIYTDRREKAKTIGPAIKTFIDHRLMLEEHDLDAILIATPQHLHCEHFVDSISAGKHVYQEKTMAFTVDHAKRMRAVYEPVKVKQVVQVGHQACSSGHVPDAQSFLAGGKLGQITAIDATMYRNTPHGKPQWWRPVRPDMNSENIVWSKFLGDAPKAPFDANRYENWRFFWDYSGGNVYENMCHQVAFWYKVLGLKIPGAVTEQVLGSDGAIMRGPQLRFLPEKMNAPQGEVLVGDTPTLPASHMRNFLAAIREGKETNCPFDLGFRVSIACRMAVESYRQGRTMRWDAAKEEIV